MRGVHRCPLVYRRYKHGRYALTPVFVFEGMSLVRGGALPPLCFEEVLSFEHWLLCVFGGRKQCACAVSPMC